MATELEDLRVLQISEQFSDAVWRMVGVWSEFSRDTVGKQIARAADSIGANIAESYGRFHYGEKINLLYYARGSLYETKYWLNRCRTRKLVDDATADNLITQLVEIARQINSFAKNLKTQRTQDKTKMVRETSSEYAAASDIDEQIVEGDGLKWLASLDPNLEPPFSLQSLVSSLESL